MSKLTSVEICAGAGGQALGLHRAGFEHALAVELDPTAAETLRLNSKGRVEVGDVADPTVWSPADYEGVDLFAGGVPCPPFSLAGKQLGSSDERDLFAWAIEQVAVIQPRALLLENVRGLAAARFSGYRQRVLDRLTQLGYVADWRLIQASDFGLAQLRPRFVLVAMKPEDAAYFRWPEPRETHITVGEALRDLMGANGWKHVDEWAALANRVGPTIVGGSKKHGGADLGPTRAKAAWAALGVDGKGVADEAPGPDAPPPSVKLPRLTVEMVARLQGWREEDDWQFAGRKTSQYRQIGNAFPPPVAEAVGRAIRDALEHKGVPHEIPELSADVHDPVYRALASADGYVSIERLIEALNEFGEASVERRLAVLAQDFELDVRTTSKGTAYRLGEFKGFTGQEDHSRHAYFEAHRNKVS
ncbi:DNA (cytosine-5-)-methyltransferase [Microbacterium sp. M28]|uniref:DNA cytosine methyltransferase n=1 Tax=Microbacterium sp. M28 TaxID=2962064 RepID=UPI0021F43493|nr:DNA (cytosine-5-)-methyltransferase [Microbacterium sp. M28]UYO96053.1 DNA (cytosine-5-)-methyltransferase [Microbacterium sp. M28]